MCIHPRCGKFPWGLGGIKFQINAGRSLISVYEINASAVKVQIKEIPNFGIWSLLNLGCLCKMVFPSRIFGGDHQQEKGAIFFKKYLQNG